MGYEPIKQETKELYLKIWINYSVGHLSIEQLAKLLQCSHDTIVNAIQWAAENRIQFKSGILAEAAKEALESRVRELKNDLVRIKEATPVNWNAVIGVNRVIKENEELLWKLEAVIPDRSFITINTTQVNQLAGARDAAMEVLNEEDRLELAGRLRQIIQKSENAKCVD
jgi:hypothetical protein